MRDKRLRALAIAIGLCVVLAFPVLVSADDPEYVVYEPTTNTYTVYPTGSDDTDNLQAAFDAAVLSGPGSTVQLVEGTYLLSRTTQVWDFVGTFKGAGMDLTTVRSIGDEPFELFYWGPMVWASFFNFDFWSAGAEENDKVHITFSDMSLCAYGETEPYINHNELTTQFGGLINVGGWNYEPSYVSTSFERMRFVGGPHPEYRSNVLWALDIEWFIESTVTVSKCIFENMDWQGILVGGMVDSTVVIGGSPSDKNTFVKSGSQQDAFNFVDLQAIILFCNSGTYAEISHCETTDWGGVYIMQRPFYWDFILTSCYYYITHNTFRQPTSYASDYAGIEIWDRWNFLFGIPTVNVVIEHNTIISETHIWPYGPIFGGYVDDVLIATNTIRGEGPSAVSVYVSEGWTIIGNNLRRFYPIFEDISLFYADYCTIVGSPNDIVWNFGIDNIIVGVNNIQGNPPSQDIADAMEQKRNIMGLFHGH